MYIKGLIETTQYNFDQTILYFNQALELYKSINFKTGVSKCYRGIGIAYSYKGEYQKSIPFFKKAMVVDEEIGDEKRSAFNLKYIGYAYSDLGEYKKAITYFNSALKINEKYNDKREIASCYNNIGILYSDQANYPLALEYHKKSLYILKELKDTLAISRSLNNIGIIYKNNQNYDKAIENYNESLKMQRKAADKHNIAKALNNLGVVYMRKKAYKNALTFFSEALAISKEINDPDNTSTCLNNMGDVYLDLKNNTVARQHYEEAKEINIEIGDQLGLCNSYLGIATTYANQKDYGNALTNALKSKELSQKLKLTNYKRDVHQLLSVIYEETGKAKKSLEHFKKFKLLNDSIFNQKNIEKITQLEYEYKYKQELELANARESKLTKEVIAVNNSLEQSQRNIFLTIIAFLATALILGGAVFYLKLRNAKAKTQNIIVEQKLLRSQMTPHFVFNALSVLQGMILSKEDNKAVNYLSKFSKLLRITLENSRDKMVLLSQELIAVENYLTLQNIESQDAYTYTIKVDDTIETTLFEIPPMLIQPFIENAIEHGFETIEAPKTIDIHLKYSNGALICTITDNGIGIDAKKKPKPPHKKSLATTITSERLSILSKDTNTSGSVTIEDRKKYGAQGTVVTLEIPYKIIQNV